MGLREQRAAADFKRPVRDSPALSELQTAAHKLVAPIAARRR